MTTTPPEGTPDAAQEDANAVDDSHKEAPSTAADQPDPDEGEEQLFGEKAMLYRFDKEGNEWKERGVGFMKILKNKETNRCRVLMRRNQTFRVCANHFVLPHMELKPHSGSDRALIWSATDFADGTESHDVLSIRFRTPEITQEFKKAFEQARAINEEELKKVEGEKKEEEKKE
ncbi:RanBP1 domain containing protein [Tritrichomonas foetus]|uniref:Ran-specific GTPase-activating protein n=1 Tax=Tritrichomonas foetus TaxID=1144522 RepID=A0A1J4J159_9EUKA|nr:RanBP1 domain containing protein [Tritrichomonas foetus]|eukprot:OHS93154.1 RanBP1 domain containing protein [Tritrichomonas foetus]